MSILSITGAQLPPDLTDVCDDFLLPVTLSLPDETGTPIVYANRPFEYLSGFKLQDILGRNFSVMSGPLTDVALAHEMEIAMAQRQRDAGSLVSYRTDQSRFLHLIAFQAIDLPQREVVMIACHAAFNPLASSIDLSETAALFDTVWRRIRHRRALDANSVTEHDFLRLEAISMRFESVFARAQNAIFKSVASDFSHFLRHASPHLSVSCVDAAPLALPEDGTLQRMPFKPDPFGRP